MQEQNLSAEVQLTSQGRLVIPAPIRRAVGIEEGNVLVYVEDGRVAIEPRDRALERLRDEVAAAWDGDDDTSVVDELLDERRQDAAREEAE